MQWTTRPIRRILIVGSYVLVAALAGAAGAWAMKQWAPSYSMPARAEFPRRLGGHSGDFAADAYRLFYATTRPAAADLRNDAAAERSSAVSLGSFDVRISPAIHVEPRVWEDPDLLEVLQPQPLAPDAFYRQLKAAADRSPHRSVLILVWGWKERWPTAAAKSAYLSYLLDIDTPVVVFDWPANQGDNARGYLGANLMARASGADLGRLVADVIEQVRPENLWVVAMSLGTQVVTDAFDHLGSLPELRDAEQEIAHVVLAAPDMSQDEFDQKFAAQLRQLSRHLTVYVSSTDQALLLSQWINRGSRVGRVVKAQPDGPVQPQFELTDSLFALQAGGSREIAVVDVTPINHHRNRHNFLTDDPEFLDELYVRLLRPADPIGRRLYLIRTKDDVGFWILWPQ